VSAQAEAAPAVPPSDLRRRVLFMALWFLVASLLFNLLFGDMGLIQGVRQRSALYRLRAEVLTLRAENALLADDVRALRQDPWRVEAIAREELGLARPGEILFLFPSEQPEDPSTSPELSQPSSRPR
jgi:cell division protein FtsB